MNKKGLSRLQLWILIEAYKYGFQLEKRKIFEDYFNGNGKGLTLYVQYQLVDLRARDLINFESLDSEQIHLTEEGKELVEGILKEQPCLLL